MEDLENHKGIVCIKIGTSSLLAHNEHCTVSLSALASLVEAVRRLRDAGHPVVVISSGAVGAGCTKLGLTSRPDALCDRQALAAIGQVHLMRFYDDLFSAVGLTCSQVLLTLDNLADPGQYASVEATMGSLLRYGVVPVVNENDTVAVEQLRIGDNDTLAAQVATLVEAQWLFLLTDVDALYTANPATHPDAVPIREVADLAALEASVGEAGAGGWGSGGMATKLVAASIATAAGVAMVICAGDPGLVPRRVLDGEPAGTLFLPATAPVVGGHQRWILAAPPKGEVCLRPEAVEELRHNRSAPVLVEDVSDAAGSFLCGETVALKDEEGHVVGRAIAKISSMGLFSHLPAHLGDAQTVVDPGELCMLPSCGAGGSVSADSEAGPSSAPSRQPSAALEEPAGALPVAVVAAS